MDFMDDLPPPPFSQSTPASERPFTFPSNVTSTHPDASTTLITPGLATSEGFYNGSGPSGEEGLGNEGANRSDPFGLDDDLDATNTLDLEPSKKRSNNMALEFENFVGIKTSETNKIDASGNIVLVKEDDPYDKLWDDLFLKRIALFPTFEEATTQATRKRQDASCPPGTAPWFEGNRPLNVPCEVFHLERLLLRLREWTFDVRPINHNLEAFADRMQNKTADVKSVMKFADHRLDMLKKFTNSDWMADALSFCEGHVRAQQAAEEAKDADRREDLLAALRALDDHENVRQSRKASAQVQQAMNSAKLSERKQKLIELKRKKESEKAMQERKASALAKRAALRQANAEKQTNGT